MNFWKILYVLRVNLVVKYRNVVCVVKMSNYFFLIVCRLKLDMPTLSLLVGEYGRGRRNGNFAFELHKYFRQEFLANNFVRSSNCAWLSNLGCSRNENKLRIVARVRKGKKHDYPWPDDIDRSGCNQLK